MKKIILALLACVLGATAAHAQKTKAQISAEITTLFPDNTVGAITPLALRTVTNDLATSIMPTAPVVSGNLACFNGTTGLLQDCGVSPGTVYTSLSGDCTATSLGVITCTKTNGVALSSLATLVPGTGVATALGVNVGSAGAPVVNGGALGTPSSGVATNLTGTASGLTAGTFTAGSATNLTSGTLPPARTNGHMNGTATNDNAAAGEVGEYQESDILPGSAVALTTSITANVTSLSLTAGDWDVGGGVVFNPGGATTYTNLVVTTGTTSATIPTSPNKGATYNVSVAYSTGAAHVIPAGTRRYSLSGTTTVYLIVQAGFGGSTLSAYGTLWARRRR